MYLETHKTEQGYSLDVYDSRGNTTYHFKTKKELAVWIKAMRRKGRYARG